MNNWVKRSFLNALATGVYVAAVAMVMQNGERIFGPIKNILGPIAFLLLFVISAAITGSLVLGKPVMLYFDGRKKEAVRIFLYTLGWLALIMIVLLIVALNWK